MNTQKFDFYNLDKDKLGKKLFSFIHFLIKLIFIGTCITDFIFYVSDRSQASTHHVRGEPPDSQLFPHCCRSIQLSSATSECGSIFLQNDPHLGLHCVPAANERPAARHRKHLTSHKFV